jgi:hypothetical protein
MFPPYKGMRHVGGNHQIAPGQAWDSGQIRRKSAGVSASYDHRTDDDCGLSGPKKFFAQKQSKTFKHCMIVLAGWVGAPRWSAAYYFYPLIFTCPS